MTAPQPKPRLELVGANGNDAGQGETVVQKWEPEHQLIGALMGLTIDQARAICELVPDHAIMDYQARWAYELIRALIARGDAPSPVLVLAAARTTACSQALDTAAPPTAVRYHRFAMYLADVFTNTVMPSTCAGAYAREVLDAAYRAAFDRHGQRMQQLAETAVDGDELVAYFAAMHADLAELHRRSQAAAAPGWWTP